MRTPLSPFAHPFHALLAACFVATGPVSGQPLRQEPFRKSMLIAPRPAHADSAGRRPETREGPQVARNGQEHLFALANRITDPAQIDTMRGLSGEDKSFLRRRYHILNPLD